MCDSNPRPLFPQSSALPMTLQQGVAKVVVLTVYRVKIAHS